MCFRFSAFLLCLSACCGAAFAQNVSANPDIEGLNAISVEFDGGGSISMPGIVPQRSIINMSKTPLQTDKTQFDDEIRALKVIKEMGDEGLLYGGILNAISALDPSYREIPHEYRIETFFGRKVTLEEAVKYFEDLQLLLKHRPDKDKFDKAYAGIEYAKEKGGDDLSMLAALHNIIAAIDPSYDDVPSEQVLGAFFGKEVTLDEAVKYFEDVDLVSKNGDDAFLEGFFRLSEEGRAKLIGEAKAAEAAEIEARERAELVRLLLWALGAVVAGIVGFLLLLWVLKWFSRKSPYARMFAFLTLLFGVGLLGLGGWYYMLLRLAVSLVCVYSAVKLRVEWAKWIFGGLAVLYNPVFPVSLGDRHVWALVNIATVVFMWVSLYAENRRAKSDPPAKSALPNP